MSTLGTDDDVRAERNPHETLSALVGVKLSIKVDANDMRRFVLENWVRLSVLAHAIHEQSQLQCGQGPYGKLLPDSAAAELPSRYSDPQHKLPPLNW